ncbi:MAG: hypothetical protein ABIG71_02440 [Candidatus Uhrbacteria bacterium]
MRRPQVSDFVPRSVDRYSHPAKDFIRRHIITQFASGIPDGIRPHLRVWCLPSDHIREIDGYCDRGIRAAHIRAFEWNDAVADKLSARCRAEAQEVVLYHGALGSFLNDPASADAQCDWANLDFDGNVMTFANEIRETVRRLRVDEAPRLALTSFISRGNGSLDRCTTIANVLRAAASDEYARGRDVVTAGNERAGLALSPKPMQHAIVREFALTSLLIDAFGSRLYGDDAVAAAAFARAYANAVSAHTRRTLAGKSADECQRARQEADEDLRHAMHERSIPLWIDDWSRFAYHSVNRKWLWVWAFRFSPVARPVSMLAWAKKLLAHPPPLHVIDRRGIPIRGRDARICAWC